MSHKRVAILISGGGSNMVALVDSMTGDHPARPCLVLSNDAGAGGLTKARARGIATAVVDHRPFAGDRPAFEAELVKPIHEAGADIVCLAGFMRVLTDGFVSQFQGRMLNIHPSLLPKYKGLHTHARALEAGDAEHGCSVHEVTARLYEDLLAMLPISLVIVLGIMLWFHRNVFVIPVVLIPILCALIWTLGLVQRHR